MKEVLTRPQESLAVRLYEIGAVKFGDFRLKLHDADPEAPLSPVYIDLRVLRRFPEAKAVAVSVYQELVNPLEFDLLADVPTAATPLVSSLADRLGVGMVTPRIDAKIHGSGAGVDGLLDWDKGKVAVLIDDLITRADTKLEAVALLNTEGIKVNDVVVLVDREQGGRQQLTDRNLNLHTALTMKGMLDFYVRAGRLSLERHHDIIKKLESLSEYLRK